MLSFATSPALKFYYCFDNRSHRNEVKPTYTLDVHLVTQVYFKWPKTYPFRIYRPPSRRRNCTRNSWLDQCTLRRLNTVQTRIRRFLQMFTPWFIQSGLFTVKKASERTIWHAPVWQCSPVYPAVHWHSHDLPVSTAWPPFSHVHSSRKQSSTSKIKAAKNVSSLVLNLW